MLDDVRNTNTFCTEANDMGKETVTQPNGKTEQLTGSSEGSHSANGSTKSNQVSSGTCLNHVICVLDLQAGGPKLHYNTPGPRNKHTVCVLSLHLSVNASSITFTACSFSLLPPQSLSSVSFLLHSSFLMCDIFP